MSSLKEFTLERVCFPQRAILNNIPPSTPTFLSFRTFKNKNIESIDLSLSCLALTHLLHHSDDMDSFNNANLPLAGFDFQQALNDAEVEAANDTTAEQQVFADNVNTNPEPGLGNTHRGYQNMPAADNTTIAQRSFGHTNMSPAPQLGNTQTAQYQNMPDASNTIIPQEPADNINTDVVPRLGYTMPGYQTRAAANNAIVNQQSSVSTNMNVGPRLGYTQSGYQQTHRVHDIPLYEQPLVDIMGQIEAQGFSIYGRPCNVIHALALHACRRGPTGIAELRVTLQRVVAAAPVSFTADPGNWTWDQMMNVINSTIQYHNQQPHHPIPGTASQVTHCMNQPHAVQMINQPSAFQQTNQPSDIHGSNQPGAFQQSNHPSAFQQVNQPAGIHAYNQPSAVPTTNQPGVIHGMNHPSAVHQTNQPYQNQSQSLHNPALSAPQHQHLGVYNPPLLFQQPPSLPSQGPAQQMAGVGATTGAQPTPEWNPKDYLYICDRCGKGERAGRDFGRHARNGTGRAGFRALRRVPEDGPPQTWRADGNNGEVYTGPMRYHPGSDDFPVPHSDVCVRNKKAWEKQREQGGHRPKTVGRRGGQAGGASQQQQAMAS
ncbi:hypothetical protein HRR78_005122 [Exophiala dermatitidis]|nr:hypothetical protein HRR78_005122 [Exophiala dermatitidis]